MQRTDSIKTNERYRTCTGIGSYNRQRHTQLFSGKRYFLFYQTATGWELEYRVPDNALLWLRDRTKGREEQVFIYKKGKQYFTVDL